MNVLDAICNRDYGAFKEIIEESLEIDKEEFYQSLIDSFVEAKRINKLFSFALEFKVNDLAKKIIDNNVLDKSSTKGFFVIAVSGSNFEVAKFFLENGFDVNDGFESRQAALSDVLCRDVEAANFLINEAGADPLAKDKKGKTLLNTLATVGDVDSIDQIVESIRQKNSLQTKESVGYLLGVNIPDDKGNTPLINAVFGGENVTVRYLVEELGADPEIRNKKKANVFTIVENGFYDRETQDYIESIKIKGMSYSTIDSPSSSCRIEQSEKVEIKSSRSKNKE